MIPDQEPRVFSENQARNACTTAIFMWDGVEIVRNKHPNLFDVWGKGCVELGLELSKYALFSEEELTRRNPDEFPGVYDYEVSNPFGQWFANQIIERNGATIGEDEAKEALLHIMDGFFDVVVFDPAEDAVEIIRALDAERNDLAARLETYQAAKDSGGLRYWALTGRIPGDDEDTLYVFHVATLNEAMDAFAEAIWEDEMDAEVSRDAVIREYGQPVFLNSVVVSDSPIEKF